MYQAARPRGALVASTEKCKKSADLEDETKPYETYGYHLTLSEMKTRIGARKLAPRDKVTVSDKVVRAHEIPELIQKFKETGFLMPMPFDTPFGVLILLSATVSLLFMLFVYAAVSDEIRIEIPFGANDINVIGFVVLGFALLMVLMGWFGIMATKSVRIGFGGSAGFIWFSVFPALAARQWWLVVIVVLLTLYGGTRSSGKLSRDWPEAEPEDKEG